MILSSSLPYGSFGLTIQLLLLLVLTPISNAFVPTIRHPSWTMPSVIGRKISSNQQRWMTSSSSDNHYYGDTPWERNKARTDIRYFLTQRSIQSFVYLLNQCREEHTIQYLEVRFSSYRSHRPCFAYMPCSVLIVTVLQCLTHHDCVCLSTENFGIYEHWRVSWNRSVQSNSISQLGFRLFGLC